MEKLHAKTSCILSKIEAEYIALSSVLQEVVSIIKLLEELKVHGLGIHNGTPNVKCKPFEDNKSCIEIATDHNTCPQTKHISVRLHNFRSYILQKTISIKHVYTAELRADIITKPLPTIQFKKLRDIIMGWKTS